MAEEWKDALGEVDKWLREQYDDEVKSANMLRTEILERMQLYALAIYLMRKMEITELKLDLKDFHAVNKYILGMGRDEEDKSMVCTFRISENLHPEPEL